MVFSFGIFLRKQKMTHPNPPELLHPMGLFFFYMMSNLALGGDFNLLHVDGCATASAWARWIQVTNIEVKSTAQGPQSGQLAASKEGEARHAQKTRQTVKEIGQHSQQEYLCRSRTAELYYWQQENNRVF